MLLGNQISLRELWYYFFVEDGEEKVHFMLSSRELWYYFFVEDGEEKVHFIP